MRTTPLTELAFALVLSEKEIATRDLLAHFLKRGYTKQGVYRALRMLREKKQIAWVKMVVRPNLVWVQTTIDQLSSLLAVRDIYRERLPRETESITFHARTLAESFLIFEQAMILILSLLPKDAPPFLFYDHHNYTYINEKSQVEWYITQLYRKSHKICLLVGSTSPLDQELKKKMHTIEVHLENKRHFKDYMSLLGDFAIYHHLDKKTLCALDMLFAQGEGPHTAEAMQMLLTEHGNFKVTITNDKKEAIRIRKLFKKYFQI